MKLISDKFGRNPDNFVDTNHTNLFNFIATSEFLLYWIREGSEN